MWGVVLPGLAHGIGWGVLRNGTVRDGTVRDVTRFTMAKAMGVLSVCSESAATEAGRLEAERVQRESRPHTGSHRALTSRLGPRRYRHCTVPGRRLGPGTGGDSGPFTPSRGRPVPS